MQPPNDSEKEEGGREGHAHLLRLAEITSPLLQELERIASFRLSMAHEAYFDMCARSVRGESPSGVLSHLHHTPGNRNWREIASSAVRHIHDGLGATYYHCSRITRIEIDSIAAISRFEPDILRVMGSRPSTIAYGSTRQLDYEYQAYLFAYRRTLEYLAGAIAACFKAECHSIRDLSKSLTKYQPKDLTERVASTLGKGLANMTDVLPPDSAVRRSPRDQTAHWSPASAGSFNLFLGEHGIQIGVIGGGEDLPPPITLFSDKAGAGTSKGGPQLGIALVQQIHRMESLIHACFRDLGIAPPGLYLPVPPPAGQTPV